MLMYANVSVKTRPNEAFARTIGLYLAMPIDSENNLILYGKDTKCRNQETKISKRNSDFNQGGESTVIL